MSVQPDWSPDGRRLSFVRDGNLLIAGATGSGATCVRTGMLLTSGAVATGAALT
jgi:Tol biopolymer transport system component